MTTGTVFVREATSADVPQIVTLSTEDELRIEGVEVDPSHDDYQRAFAAIDADANNAIFVAVENEKVVGTFQRTFIQHLTRRGYVACQVESVVVAKAQRGRGIGEAMMRVAIDEAKARGCKRVQLTSQKVRERAHVFYARLGFVASHEGMKLWL